MPQGDLQAVDYEAGRPAFESRSPGWHLMVAESAARTTVMAWVGTP